MLNEELEQERSSYRSHLFEFIRDRTIAFADREASGEDINVSWNLVRSTGNTVWLAHQLGQISDEEAKGFCEQMTLACPSLRERILKGWQEGFGMTE
ncbi:MAG: hypothetical protein NTZ07_02700 [Candidatus Woesebacteria bacterium]|nr:hypothetical protein [Candidatus Woesebacteria bacterium]